MKIPFPAITKIVLLWLGWAAIIILFQAVVFARFQLERPDNTLAWTPESTRKHDWRPDINFPNLFLRTHSAWDSNFYLSIAENGYGNMRLPKFTIPSGKKLSADYAFLPFYPLLTRIFATPLLVAGFDIKKSLILSGMLVSLFGTLAAMCALYDLAQGHLGDNGALRTVFYLLILPTSFFFAQVYTEGLFIGLTLVSFAFLQRRRLFFSSVFAVMATLTRSVGILLVIPIAFSVLSDLKRSSWKIFGNKEFWVGSFFAALPVFAYGIWRVSWLGTAFQYAETFHFGRGIFLLGKTLYSLDQVIFFLRYGDPAARIYYLLEIGMVGAGFLASVASIRKYPWISLFSLAVIGISLFSGVFQSQSRYVLGAPSLYLFLGELGRFKIFDRLFTLLSILLMGMLLILFTFDFWVA